LAHLSPATRAPERSAFATALPSQGLPFGLTSIRVRSGVRLSGNLAVRLIAHWGLRSRALEQILTRSTRFAIQLGVTTAGAVLDYFVGRLTNKLTLGILCWVLLTIVAAASLDFAKDIFHGHRDRNDGATGRYSSGDGLTTVAGVIRGRYDRFRWATVVNSLVVAAFAGIASYAFAAAVITLRVIAVHNGPELGKSSLYDQSAISFISSFQTSSTAAWFIVACFGLALLLRPPVVLPLGVAAISVANTILLPLPALSPAAPALDSQLSYSLSTPDTWLFALPVKFVVLGCLAAFAVGLAACGAINRRIGRSA
jgi:hypothetical protein